MYIAFRKEASVILPSCPYSFYPLQWSGLTENKEKLIEKLIEKASINGDKLTENKIAILTLMIEDPYISKSDLSKFVGISTAAISNNIEAMRGKYLRRVGPDKGGFWEIIE